MSAKYDQMTSLSEHGHSVPVVFAGSSMMASGIDPNAFTARAGIDSYNAAVAGPGMTGLRPWVRDLTQPLLSADTVVLGIQSRELNDEERVIAHFHDVLMRSPGFDLATPRSIADHVETWLDRSSAFFRNRRAFRTPVTLFEQRVGQRSHSVGRRGVRRQEDRFYRHRLKLDGREAGVPARNPGPRDLAPPDAFSIGGSQLDALEALASELARRDVRLVVIAMPVTRDYRLSFPPIRRRFFTALGELSDKHGITVIDAQDAFPWFGPFRDPIHLDVEGRSALSDALGRDWTRLDGRRGYFRVVCDQKPRCGLRRIEELGPSNRMTPGRRHAYPSPTGGRETAP
jgi:hypothetical protein